VSATSEPGRSAHGYDLSIVRPLGAYPATQCPCRLQFSILPPEGVVPIPVDDVLQARFDAGNEFENLIFADLLGHHPEAVEVAAGSKAEMIAATVAAMAKKTPLILGGWLPDDDAGRRTGKPDVLLYDIDGYLPVDVKVYGLFHADDEAKQAVRISTLERPSLDDATVEHGTLSSEKRKKAALQLAHYWRILEACGQTSARGAFGAIIDANEQLVWIDLNAPDARIQNKTKVEDEPVTWLRSYDHEFGFRRDVAAHTAMRKDGEPLDLKVVPVAISECGTCEWNSYCRPDLEERDHISLLPNMGYWDYRRLRLAGITTRRQVAERDHFTADVVKRLSAAQLKAALDPAKASMPLAQLWAKAQTVQPFAASLAEAGIVTAEDLAGRLTDAVALDLAGGLRPEWIDQARASVLGTPLLARGFTTLGLPTYDVEVDFDMENDLDGAVYLWGLLVNETYEVIDEYSHPTDEAAVFVQFWKRATDLVAQATSAGQSIQFFYWSRAELTMAKRICDPGSDGRAGPQGPIETGLPPVDEVEAFFASHCTDLEAVLKDHFVMPAGTSVKKVAPLAGHDWSAVHDLEDPDSDGEGASGDVSMLKHRFAVEDPDPAKREAAKLWLRTYNEQDVIATLRVREWMRASASTLPRADDERTG
jgi:predicted RecB family nuclease